MKTLSQLLLTFLLNAGWQVALVAAVASVCVSLLRRTAARHRHLIWLSGLVIALALPLLTLLRLATGSLNFAPVEQQSRQTLDALPAVNGAVRAPLPDDFDIASSQAKRNLPVELNAAIAFTVIALYFSFLFYRVVKFVKAWRRTCAIRASAHSIGEGEELQAVIGRCQRAIGVDSFKVLGSAIVPVPITVGFRRPLVILPDELLLQGHADVLTSAIGHELVHVWRRDYLLNLIYELIYLPLSFHPAAALVRRRINQTRELVCDELVTEKLLAAEVYAHSLVRLAGAAVPFGRDATLTVGITDADILEVRIMSLLRRPKLGTPRKKLLLIAVSLLLAIPCVAAASFGLRLNIKSPDTESARQEARAVDVSAAGAKTRVIYRADPEYGLDARARNLGGWEQDQDKEKRAKRELEEKQKAENETKTGTVVTVDGSGYEVRTDQEMNEKKMKELAARDPQFKAELDAKEHRWKEEREVEAKRDAELSRMAKVSMDQAIQIATSQQPGKVLECSLVGEHWEAPGKLAKDGMVLYHVVILSGDEASPTKTHVLINAVDGSLFRSEKENRKRELN